MTEEKMQVLAYGLYVIKNTFPEIYMNYMVWAVATTPDTFMGYDDKFVDYEFRRYFFYLTPGARDNVLQALQAIGETDAQALEEPVLFNMK